MRFCCTYIPHICSAYMHICSAYVQDICSIFDIYILHMYDIYWQTCHVWDSNAYVTYMWHICGVHGEHVWHVICYLYVAYMIHDDIYVTYDRVTCTTLYGVYICDIYVSHICDMCVAHMCDVEPAYTVFIYVTYMCHICVTCAWHMCDT